MVRRFGIAIFAAFGLLLPDATAGEPRLVFEADILPVLNAHCLQCHGGVHQKNDLDLRTLAGLLKGGKSGPAVVAGKPSESLLWNKIAKDEMPKTDNKVSEANKKRIRDWIEAGANGRDGKSAEAITRAARKPIEVAKRLDAGIDAKLAAAKISPAKKADDAEFLRRAFLDIAGRPPTAEKTSAYLDDPNPRKRAKLIDELLASPDYGRHLAEWWVNLFYLATVSQRPADPTPFKEWLGKGLNDGRGWDALIRETLTATGPLADAPQGLFFYYNSDMNGQVLPKILAGNIAQVFLGTQLQCAECHDHPFAPWKQTDFWSVASFFGQTTRMETVENKNTPGVKDRHLETRPGRQPTILKEIAISIPKDGEARHGGKKVPAAFLDGRPLEADPMKNHRVPFAEWLTARDNRSFARAAVNRFWAHFFGRGFVNPLNDFGDHNAPSHPALLDELADEFIASNFDVKHLVRCICLTQAYQRTSRVSPGSDKADAEALFGRMTSKVLTPEQLYDALCVALEVPEILPPADPKKKPNPKGPQPPSARTQFVSFFRNPGDVDEPTELKLGVPHVLRLMNDSNFNTGGKLVERVAASAKSPEEAVEMLFLAVLGRPPAEAERRRFVEFVSAQPAAADAYRRVVWVLINSTDFILNN